MVKGLTEMIETWRVDRNLRTKSILNQISTLVFFGKKNIDSLDEKEYYDLVLKSFDATQHLPHAFDWLDYIDESLLPLREYLKHPCAETQSNFSKSFVKCLMNFFKTSLDILFEEEVQLRSTQ